MRSSDQELTGGTDPHQLIISAAYLVVYIDDGRTTLHFEGRNGVPVTRMASDA
jgi:hypothetical protein